MENKYPVAGILTVLTLPVLILLGCESHTTQPLELRHDNLLRKQYSITDANSYVQYYYNSSNEIIRIESYGSSGLQRKSEFHYDDENNLIKEEVYHTYYGVPEYYYANHDYDNRTLLIRSSYYLLVSGSYQFRSFSTFEYDHNNRIILESLHDTTGTKTQHWRVFYDSVGNVAEIRHFFGQTLIFDDVFQYDNKKNPLELTNVHVEAQNLSPNNIVKHVQRNFSMNGADYTHTYEHEYNKDDYPIARACLDSTTNVYLSKIIFEYY